MPQNRGRNRLHVIRNEVAAAIHGGNRFGHHHQADGRARACPQAERGPLARAPHQGGNVAEERGLNFDLRHLPASHGQQGGIHWEQSAFLQLAGIEAILIIFQDLGLMLSGRIRDQNLHEKTIKLRLGQRIRSFELHRVLRGEHGEKAGKRMARSINRDLPLFHRFQQRRLGAGRGAVNLIDQQQIGEDRAAMQGKASRRHIEYVGAEYVGGHQIGGALHPLKLQLQQARHGFDGKRLRQPGHTFHQAVAGAEDDQQELVDDRLLPHDDLAQLGTDVRRQLAHRFNIANCVADCFHRSSPFECAAKAVAPACTAAMPGPTARLHPR